MIKVTSNAILEALSEINIKETADRTSIRMWMGNPYGFDKALNDALSSDLVIMETVHTRGGVRVMYTPWYNSPIN